MKMSIEEFDEMMETYVASQDAERCDEHYTTDSAMARYVLEGLRQSLYSAQLEKKARFEQYVLLHEEFGNCTKELL